MRFFALAALISFAAAAPSALDKAAIEARALLSEAIDWPSSSHANGNQAYQYQITSLGGDSYKVAFFNSEAPNADVTFKYTAQAIGTGADGKVISTTLSQGHSTSYTVEKSGTQIEFTIDYA